MFKSLFVRLFTTWMLIFVAVLLVLSVVIVNILWTLEYEKGVEETKRLAETIAQQYDYAKRGQISNYVFATTITETVTESQSTVWLINRSGSSSNFVPEIVEPEITLTEIEIQQYLQQVLQGQELIIAQAFGERFNSQVVSVILPLKFIDNIDGAVFVHRQINVFLQSLMPTFRGIAIVMLACLLVGIALIYYTSLKITKPLQEFARVANSVAKGDFQNRVTVSSRDELGRLAIVFNRMILELRGTEELRKNFVSNVSHELRSPLTSMQGYLQGILDDTIEKTEQKMYLSIALEQTKHLTHLVNDLLHLSRLEAGMALSITTFDINEMLRRQIISYEGRIEEKHLDVEVSFHAQSCIVQADADRMQQVISNLLDNAIKFSKDYGLLEVATQRDEHLTYVTIKDNGEGIPEEDIEHVFERFYKVDKAHTSGSGTGLGLCIVDMILKQHGQSIQVDSQVSKGAAFVFTIENA